jgi:uncharacterized membrane protein
MNKSVQTDIVQNIFRVILGGFMILAAAGHLTFQRGEFQAQVPDWVPMDKDLVVILSGVVELMLGIWMVFLTKTKVYAGMALAIFYVLVFPGNIAQYLNGTSAFGLDTDQKRLIRLFFQPVLILWALWSTGAWKALNENSKIQNRTESEF